MQVEGVTEGLASRLLLPILSNGTFQPKMRRRDEEDYGEACGWRPVRLTPQLRSSAPTLAPPRVSFKLILHEDGKT